MASRVLKLYTLCGTSQVTDYRKLLLERTGSRSVASTPHQSGTVYLMIHPTPRKSLSTINKILAVLNEELETKGESKFTILHTESLAWCFVSNKRADPFHHKFFVLEKGRHVPLRDLNLLTNQDVPEKVVYSSVKKKTKEMKEMMWKKHSEALEDIIVKHLSRPGLGPMSRLVEICEFIDVPVQVSNMTAMWKQAQLKVHSDKNWKNGMMSSFYNKISRVLNEIPKPCVYLFCVKSRCHNSQFA